MNKALVKNWNSVVSKDDIVYHAGDFAFANKSSVEELVQKLNGKIRLVRGNHDSHSNKWFRDAGFDEVYDKPILYNDFFIISHEPVYLTAAMPYINIHGHTHGKAMSGANYVNVSVEQINYTPIDFEDIKKKFMLPNKDSYDDDQTICGREE